MLCDERVDQKTRFMSSVAAVDYVSSGFFQQLPNRRSLHPSRLGSPPLNARCGGKASVTWRGPGCTPSNNRSCGNRPCGDRLGGEAACQFLQAAWLKPLLIKILGTCLLPGINVLPMHILLQLALAHYSRRPQMGQGSTRISTRSALRSSI